MTKVPSLTKLPYFTRLDRISPVHRLLAFYQAAVANGLPVALWRYPFSKDMYALVDLSGKAQPTKINFEQERPGFAFAPFINEGGRATLFLKAGVMLKPQGAFLYEDQGTSSGIDETINQIQFLNHFQALTLDDDYTNWGRSAIPVTTKTPRCCHEDSYRALVEDAVAYIRSTDIKKVVTSRATEIRLPTGFNPVAAFEKLCARYRSAFISLVSIPQVGTWIGASPETLLTLNDSYLETIALAGTQARPDDNALADVVWGAKEIEEQALVSDYIRDFFQKLGITTFEEEGPRTVSAGNVVHLKTNFRVDAGTMWSPGGLRRLGNHILDNLHPTSAVCGMPKKEALSFILEKERYDRAFYSGFLGPVHIEGQSRLFVNLRCMQLAANHAILYIGGGITKDSVPELEWQETVLKSKTLLPVLETADIFEPALDLTR
jgi:isochorismate synthase